MEAERWKELYELMKKERDYYMQKLEELIFKINEEDK